MNLSIKNALPEDIATFERIKKSLGEEATAKNALSYIIKAVTQPQQGGKPEAAEKSNTLTTQVTDLQSQVTQLNQQCDQLQQQNNELSRQAEAAVTLKENQFIVTTGPKVAAAITAVETGFYEKQLTTNTDRSQYPSELAKYAIRFLIENTFLKKYIK